VVPVVLEEFRSCFVFVFRVHGQLAPHFGQRIQHPCLRVTLFMSPDVGEKNHVTCCRTPVCCVSRFALVTRTADLLPSGSPDAGLQFAFTVVVLVVVVVVVGELVVVVSSCSSGSSGSSGSSE